MPIPKTGMNLSFIFMGALYFFQMVCSSHPCKIKYSPSYTAIFSYQMMGFR